MTNAAAAPARHVAVVVVHGVGETVPGYAMNELIDSMQRAFPDAVAADKHAEVHPLVGRALVVGGADDSFPAFARNARLTSGEQVRFYELYWADLTRVLPGRLNAMLGGFRVIFESHHFIDAMLADDGGPLTRTLRRLLLLAGALLRGPIAGLNICMIAIALTYYFGRGLLGEMSGSKPAWLVYSVMTAVFLVSAALLARGLRRHATEWNDVYIGTLLFALLVSGYTWLLTQFPDHWFLAGRKDIAGGQLCLYVERFYYMMQSAWGLWWLTMALALAVLVLLALFGSGRNEASRSAAIAAVDVAALQGAMWVAIICVFSLPMLREAAVRNIPVCSLERISVFFATTAGALFAVAFVALATYAVRAALGRLSLLSLETRAWLMPRMLFGGGVTVAIVVGAVVNVTIFNLMYFVSFHDNNILFRWIAGSFDGDGGRKLIALVDELQPYIFGAASVVAAGTGLLFASGATTAIHIARDLIDHQYRPDLGYSHRLLRSKWRHGPQRPRRLRISERLNTLFRELICQRNFDDLVFVVHSQGSIIVYDYLRSGGEMCEQLLRVRPHLVTFGSPLGHLYRFYFKEYSNLERSISGLAPKLASWTNLYRVDDYVGREIAGDPLIYNKVMHPGGHTAYWGEPDLIDVVLARIRAPTADRAASAGSVA